MNSKRNRKKEGFLNVKQSTRSSLGKAWKRKWVVVQQNTSSTGKSILLELYMEKGAYHKTVTSLLLEGVVSVRRIRSKTQEHAVEISSASKVLLGVSADSETETQEWLAMFQMNLMAPIKELPCPPGIPEDFVRVSVIPNKDSERLELSGDYFAHISLTCINLYNTNTGDVSLEWDLRHLKKFMLISKCHPHDADKILHILPSKRSQHGEAEIIFFSAKGKQLVEGLYEKLSNAMTVKARRSRSTSMLFEISPQELEMMLKTTEQLSKEALEEDEEGEKGVFEEAVVEEVNGKEIDKAANESKESEANGLEGDDTAVVNGKVLNKPAPIDDKHGGIIAEEKEVMEKDVNRVNEVEESEDVPKESEETADGTTVATETVVDTTVANEKQVKGIKEEIEATEMSGGFQKDSEAVLAVEKKELAQEEVNDGEDRLGLVEEEAAPKSSLEEVAQQFGGISTENKDVNQQSMEEMKTKNAKDSEVITNTDDILDDDKCNQTNPEEMDDVGVETEASTSLVQIHEVHATSKEDDTLRRECHEDGNAGANEGSDGHDPCIIPQNTDYDATASTELDPSQYTSEAAPANGDVVATHNDTPTLETNIASSDILEDSRDPKDGEQDIKAIEPSTLDGKPSEDQSNANKLEATIIIRESKTEADPSSNINLEEFEQDTRSEQTSTDGGLMEENPTELVGSTQESVVETIVHESSTEAQSIATSTNLGQSNDMQLTNDTVESLENSEQGPPESADKEAGSDNRVMDTSDITKGVEISVEPPEFHTEEVVELVHVLNPNQNNNNSNTDVPVRRNSQTVMPNSLTSRMAEALRNAHKRKVSTETAPNYKQIETGRLSPDPKRTEETSEIIV